MTDRTNWQIGFTKDKIRWGTWRTSSAPIRGWVVYFSGRSEFIEKYHYLPHDLGLPADIGYLTWDHRGQGASGGVRAHITTYDEYAQDAANILQTVGENLPFVAITHSMGSLIALYGTMRGLFQPQKLLLSSPFLGLPRTLIPNKWAEIISGKMAEWSFGHVPTISDMPARFEQNMLTTSRQRYQLLTESGFTFHAPTFSWVHATTQAMKLVHQAENLRYLPRKIKIFASAGETVVDAAAIVRWAALARQNGMTVDVTAIPDALHEVFAESPAPYQLAIRETKEWAHPYLEVERLVG